MSVILKSGASANLANIDANGSLQTSGPLTSAQAGFVSIVAENDTGELTGSRYMKEPEVSADYRLRVGVDNMLFNEYFPGTAINTTIWSSAVTTMTNAVTNGFCVLNSGNSVASGAVSQLRTYRHFPWYKQYTMYIEMEIQFAKVPQSNNRCEAGCFLASGTSAVTDGIFLRLNESAEFRLVMTHNGTETTALLDSSLIDPNVTHTWLIYIHNNELKLWRDNILVTALDVPAGQSTPAMSMNLPLAFRNYNTGVVSAAQVMKVGAVNVTLGDQAINKPWGHILAGQGAHSSQGQTGATLGSTAIYTNAAPAAAAALTNTTAAAGNTGLGGIIQVLPTLTAGTDGILVSYQVPAGTAALPGRSLYITRVTIDSAVTTVLVGGPVIASFSIAYGHTAVSLATAEAATTKAPRRMPLGIQVYGAAAAVASTASRISEDFNQCPIVVQPGEFIALAMRNLGTVTSSGVITFVVSISGYWE